MDAMGFSNGRNLNETEVMVIFNDSRRHVIGGKGTCDALKIAYIIQRVTNTPNTIIQLRFYLPVQESVWERAELLLPGWRVLSVLCQLDERCLLSP